MDIQRLLGASPMIAARRDGFLPGFSCITSKALALTMPTLLR